MVKPYRIKGVRHFKVREYALALKKTSKGYRPAPTRTVYAHSFKAAAKRLKVSPFVMKTYGIIVKKRR